MVSPHLFTYNHFNDVWEATLEPWFREHATSVCMDSLPSVVLTPSHAWGSVLKKHLFQAGIATIGLRFWTLKELRHYFLQTFFPERHLALREDLHLFMAIAATIGLSSCREKSDSFEDSMHICQSVAATPERFMATYDAIAVAGFDSTIFEAKIWRLIASHFEKLMAQSGLFPYWQLDRLFVEKGRTSKTLKNLLIIGFEEGDWKSITLMHAALEQAKDAILCWSLSEGTGNKSSQLAWAGNWEEWYSDFETLPSVCSSYQQLILFLEREEAQPPPLVHYRIADNLCEEGNIIVQQTLCYLADSKVDQVGIVFPNPSALARQVALLLKQFKVPHYDGIGALSPLDEKQTLILHWIVLQEEAELDSLLSFIAILCERQIMTQAFAKKIRRVFRSAFEDTLTNDLTVIRAYLSDMAAGEQAIAFLEEWVSLPLRGSLHIFFEKTVAQLTKLTDEVFQPFFSNNIPILTRFNDEPVERKVFLKWLREMLNASKRKRLKTDNNPLTRVLLLLAEDAVGLSFDQLILAGLNQKNGSFQGQEYVGLSEEYIKRLNRSFIRTGSQGEGHWVTSEDKGLISSSSQLKALFWDRFDWMTTNALHLTLTASRFSEESSSQPEPISECLIHFYQKHKGEMLDAVGLEKLSVLTKEWMVDLATVLKGAQDKNPVGPLTSTAKTLKAFETRRKGEEPFGEFEMSYRKDSHGKLSFSCKTWECFLQRPALVWFEHVLRVKPSTLFNAPIQWRLTQGSWIHLWLSLESDRPFMKRPDKEAWSQAVNKRAASLRLAVRQAYEKAGRSLPDWWNACWTEALHNALHFVELLAEVKDWDYMASEWRLPEHCVARMDNGQAGLSLHGRMDLVFSTNALMQDVHDFASTELWVIDFKTGGDPKLTIRHLQNGKGVQLALYAIALHSLGCKKTFVSLVKSDTLPSNIHMENRLKATELIELKDLWQGLLQVQERGVLGMGSAIRSEHHFVGDFPLATLSIPQNILERKWRLSHPLLPLPESLLLN